MNIELIISARDDSATVRAVVDPFAYPENTVTQLTLLKSLRAAHPLLVLYTCFAVCGD